MTRARFVAPARREFLAEIAYYLSIEPRLGAQFASAVEDAVARAIAFPEAGSPAPSSTRRIFLRDFPFSLIYREYPNEVVVFAIAHHSRLPDYWQSRVQDR